MSLQRMSACCPLALIVCCLATNCERPTTRPPGGPSSEVGETQQHDAPRPEDAAEPVMGVAERSPGPRGRSPEPLEGEDAGQAAVEAQVTSAPDAELVEQYETMLAEQREYDRTHHAGTVARVLARMEEHMRTQPVMSVAPFLHHSEWEIRLSAARALIGRPEARQDGVRLALARAVRTDGNQYSLREILQAIAYTKAGQATRDLSDLMVHHEDSEIRRAAVDAQYSIRAPEAVPGLLEATRDTDQDVANRAVYVLAHIGDARALPRIRTLAFGSGPRAQLFAIQALGIMRDRESGDELTRLLRQRDEELIVTTISALGRIGHDGAVSTLARFLDHENRKVAESAFVALCSIGNRDVLELFLQRHVGNPEDESLLGAIASAYDKCREGLEDIAQTMPAAERTRLAQHVSTVLARSEAVELRKEVRPHHLREIRRFGEWHFVTVDFGRHGVMLLVRRERQRNWTSSRLLGGWTE